MANPERDRKTINVKGMLVKSWDRATAAAGKRDESYGTWLSRACDTQANLEAGERLIEPGNPEPVKGNPAKTLEPGEVAALMQGFAATVAATGVQPRVALVKQAYAAMESLLPEPPEPRMVTQDRAENGRFLKGNPEVKKLILDGNPG